MARLFSSVVKSKIEEHINLSEEQSGFRRGRSCLDNIHCVRQLIEKNRDKQIDTHMTFIDLEKAYDSIPRCELWKAMRRVNIREKWIQIVQMMYYKTEAHIKIGNKITPIINITKGLKQGCGLSPLLFNVYVEQALDTWYRKCAGMGIPIDNSTLHSLLFADDQIVFAQDEEDMEYMLRKLTEEFEKWGLKLNYQKTEYMCVGREAQNIRIEDVDIKTCTTFKYLGSLLSSTGTCERDINARIIMGKKATKALHGLLWNRNISQDTKKRLFHSVVENIVLYGAEMWPLTKNIRNKIRTVEMDFMRRCLQVTRRDRLRTEEIWRRMNITCSITKTLENRALQWYGHVRRMPEDRWPKKVTQWFPRGKRKRGRPALTWEKYIKTAMEERGLQEADWEDRRLWKQKTENPMG